MRKLYLFTMLTLPVFVNLAHAEDEAMKAYADRHDFFATMVDTLPGRWEGQYANGSYDDPRGEWRPIIVEYEVSAGGTALVENYLTPDDSVIMTTVYHQDNNDIRATHFCGAMNHPRMVTSGFDADRHTLSFDFVDVANLKSANDYHSRGIDVRLVDRDEVHVTFSGLEDGKESTRVFALERVKN